MQFSVSQGHNNVEVINSPPSQDHNQTLQKHENLLGELRRRLLYLHLM